MASHIISGHSQDEGTDGAHHQQLLPQGGCLVNNAAGYGRGFQPSL